MGQSGSGSFEGIWDSQVEKHGTGWKRVWIGVRLRGVGQTIKRL